MSNRLLMIMAALCALTLGSCVHEFPKAPDTRGVDITISHDQSWTYHEMTISRGALKIRDGWFEDDADSKTSEPTMARYHFLVTPVENNNIVVLEEEQHFDDLERNDFTTHLDIPAGNYNIWVWSDYSHAETKQSHHYDSSDFLNIKYTQPYRGNDESRDSFRGQTSISIANTIDHEMPLSAHIDMERPLARYHFIATDLEEFIERELESRRNEQEQGSRTMSKAEYEQYGFDAPLLKPFLAAYRVEMVYTGYMPSTFNNFINRPVDSATGVTFSSNIQLTVDDEASLGFDYVMVNGHESSIPVAMNIYDKDDNLIGATNAISVPIVRGRTTIVRGKFLTSRASAGVGIDPSFDGDFNIEIK